MKKVLIVAMLLVGVFVLSGCGIMPKPITADEYIAAAEELDYSVKDIPQDPDSSYERIVEVTTYPTYEMVFIEFKSKDAAIDEVEDFKYFECGHGDTRDVRRKISFGDSERVLYKLDAQFNYICRAGNTVAYFIGSDAYKPEASALIRAIGY